VADDGSKQISQILNGIDQLLPELESIYKDIHSHPELSM
jgi:hippurate hydrolase